MLIKRCGKKKFLCDCFSFLLIINFTFTFTLSLAIAAPVNASAEAPPLVQTSLSYDNYHWSLYIQDLMMHRSRYLADTLNDNTSRIITQSALIKRFQLRYHFNPRWNIGSAFSLGLRDELQKVNDLVVDQYHPFKALSFMSGFQMFNYRFPRARLEAWLNLRSNMALSRRWLKKTSLQSDLEVALVFDSSTLVTLGAEIFRNIDDGGFYAIQYGVGWRF
ncbi:MAG: hypothetical protein OEY38_12535 [Gammaproteobacteria bacterium]|nr:hypothetical protein [Gammaproteobacteria bacterium]